MRQSVAEATWHAAHRSAFGATLADQPLMDSVLADLCVESEAATASVMRLARAYDNDADEDEQLFARIGTAVMKYWVCKRGPGHASEALECLGGNGYCETFPLARVYREQPLQSIWEGSGNVVCVDVLRALSKTPRALTAFLDEVNRARGADTRLDKYLRQLREDLHRDSDLATRQRTARLLVERLALALQGSLLVRHAPPPVADAFCATRLTRDGGHEYGAIPYAVDTRTVIPRHTPADA